MPVNAVDKGLYQMPTGIAGTGEEPVIEIEIELPDAQNNGVTSLQPTEEKADFYADIAGDYDEGALQTFASDLLDSIQEDLRARADWEKMYVEGVNLLGLKYEQRNEPWTGACGVFHPMITEAVIRFQADTMLETFPAAGPVKTTIVGKLTEDKEKAAKRVEQDLNWQLMENMPEFRSDHERMLWNLPGAGCAFKKVYDCPILGRQTSVFVPAEDIIIPYGTSDLLTCERMAHRMKKTKLEVKQLMESGVWRQIDLPEPSPDMPNKVQDKKDKETGNKELLDNRYTFYEISVNIDLDRLKEGESGDVDERESSSGVPCIITVLDRTMHVVGLRRNWREDDAKKLRRMHFVQYNYVPGYGAYGFGLFHLLGGFATSATSIMRQLVDAGTLSNLPGGLKAKGLRVKGEDEPIQPGEFRDVDVAGGTIRDNIMPLPYKEPSATLYNLLLNIVEEGRRFAATNDIKVADMSSQAPVGTTLAVLERQLRTMTAVQARVHFSFKQELRLIADIVKDNTSPAGYDYDVDAPQGRMAKAEDYGQVSIIPVSDPNAATMSQRVVQYQAVIQLAGTAPQIYDMTELHRQMLTVLGIKNIGKLVPTEDDIKVVDPVQENQNILNGKPVKAWDWQDHEAHIRVHMAMATDPLVQELVGQNPQASKIAAAMAAHVTEHVGFAYRNKIQQALGASLPVMGKDDSLPEHMEVEISRRLAQAAPMVLQQSQQIAAQAQAQKNAQDPVLVAQQQEQENAKAEISRKSARDKEDIRIQDEKLRIEAATKGVDPAQIAADQMLTAMQARHKAQMDEQTSRHKQELDSASMAVSVGQKVAQQRQSEQRHRQQMQIDAQRSSAELEAKMQQMRNIDEQHRASIKQREEAHTATLDAKRKQTAAAAKAKPVVGAKK